jgi:hypothetical protein
MSRTNNKAKQDMQSDQITGAEFRNKDLSLSPLIVTISLPDAVSLNPFASYPMSTSFIEVYFIEFYQPAGTESITSGLAIMYRLFDFHFIAR